MTTQTTLTLEQYDRLSLLLNKAYAVADTLQSVSTSQSPIEGETLSWIAWAQRDDIGEAREILGLGAWNE